MTILREATAEDAADVAALHADSWRRFYRGAYSDAFLDGPVFDDRLAVWTARLGAPGDTRTVVAYDDAGLAGFVHVAFGADERWGNLVDNLHVRHDRQRGGLGRALLSGALQPPVYLWVLEQNTAAQRFYAAMGGEVVEAVQVRAPGGDPANLVGAPKKLRVVFAGA